MAGDLTILIAPGRIDLSILVDAARETFKDREGGDLVALFMDEEAADPALGDRVGPFTATSFWTQGNDDVAIEAFVAELSKRIGAPRILVAWATEFFGSSGWRVFQAGKVGRAEVFKDDGVGVTAIKPGGIEAALGKPCLGFDVNKLAFGARGVRLLPLEEAGAAVGKEEAERVLYDADPLLFTGQGEFKTVRRPRPKRRARRLNTAVTEFPADWRGWAKANLDSAAAMPRVLKFLDEGGVDEREARAHVTGVLREKRDALAKNGRNEVLAGLAILLFGATWLLAPLAARRGRIEDPVTKVAIMAVGAVLAGFGVRERFRASACDPGEHSLNERMTSGK